MTLNLDLNSIIDCEDIGSDIRSLVEDTEDTRLILWILLSTPSTSIGR